MVKPLNIIIAKDEGFNYEMKLTSILDIQCSSFDIFE